MISPHLIKQTVPSWKQNNGENNRLSLALAPSQGNTMYIKWDHFYSTCRISKGALTWIDANVTTRQLQDGFRLSDCLLIE